MIMLNRTFSFLLILVFTFSISLSEPNLASPIKKIKYDQFEMASYELKTFLKISVRNKDKIYFWLGYIDYKKESFQTAADKFQKGLLVNDQSSWNLLGMAFLLIEENKMEEADALLEKASSYHGDDNREFDYLLAEAYLNGGQPLAKISTKKMRNVLSELSARHLKSPRPHVLLGKYYEKMGVPELGLEEYKTAIKADSSFMPAYIALAKLYNNEAKKNNDPRSIKIGLQIANKAIKVNPGYPPAYKMRSKLYQELGKTDLAKTDRETYLSMTEKPPIPYFPFVILGFLFGGLLFLLGYFRAE